MHPYYDTSNEPDFFEEQHPATKREIPPLEVLMEQFRKLAITQNRIDELKEEIATLSSSRKDNFKRMALYDTIREQKSYQAKQIERCDEVALITLAHYIVQKKNEQDVSASYLKDYMEKQRAMYQHLNSNIN